MRIVHFSCHDLKGGAAKSSYRLHHSLLRHGEESRLFVRNKVAAERNIIEFRPPPGVFNTLYRTTRSLHLYLEGAAVRRRPREKLEVFTNVRTKFGMQVAPGCPKCDIVNLHWVAGFVDTTSFFAHVKQPVVWTLHDMNAFTGGCHFDQECGRYESQCGACPQLGSMRRRDFSRIVFARKARVYQALAQDGLRIVCPSKWLADKVAKSPLMQRFDTRVIPYGIETNIFVPRDASCLRRAFNIPTDARVVLFVADHLGSYRKGFDLLMETLMQSGGMSSILLSVGNAKLLTKRLSENVLCVGNVENETILSMLYSLADIFVITARQDNLPNTVLESMACGTPVMGFHVGGIPEMVEDGKSGHLVPVGATRDLRQAIDAVLQDESKLRQMSTSCRNTVMERFDSNMQAGRYVELYNEILARRPQRSQE